VVTPRKKAKTAEAELKTADELAYKTAEPLIKVEGEVEEHTVKVEKAEVKAEEQRLSADTTRIVKADPDAEAALKGSQGLAKEPQPQAKSKKSRAKNY
jgi:hypothetical protein